MIKIMKIMFICTGNICRSAMAEVLLKTKSENCKNEIEVYSCGVFAEDGARASSKSIEILKEKYNVDLTQHKATHIRNSNIEEMDLILCMTLAHKIMVVQMYPKLKDKIYTLKEYAKMQDMDIKDPWGLSSEVYERVAKEINDCIEIMIQTI